MRHTPNEIAASPEWVTASRNDRGVTSVGGGWNVLSAPIGRGRSYTDFESRVMSVPVGDDDRSLAVRLHELGHARFSPVDIPVQLSQSLGISHDALVVAEELRVNTILRNNYETRGIRHLVDGSERGTADLIVAKEDWNSAVLLLASTFGTDAYKVVKRRLKLHDKWRKPVEAVHRIIKKNLDLLWVAERNSTTPIEGSWATERGVVRTAVFPKGFVEGSIPLATLLDGIMSVSADSVEKKEHENGDSSDEEGDGEEGDGEEGDGNDEFAGLDSMAGRVKWVPLQIGMTRLTEASARFVGRRRRASIMGKVIRHPERLLTDPERRLFTQEVRGVSGVVCVDVSGSMSLTDDELTAILSHAPGCTVLAYSQSYRGGANAYVVARNGRRVSREHLEKLPLGMGNGCDLPALQWSVRQRKHSKDFVLWVSDGYVTGMDDHHSLDLVDECLLFCEKHKISNASDSLEAISMLAEVSRGRSLPLRYSAPILIEAKKRINSRSAKGKKK